MHLKVRSFRSVNTGVGAFEYLPGHGRIRKKSHHFEAQIVGVLRFTVGALDWSRVFL